jgi:hypothetical protein
MTEWFLIVWLTSVQNQLSLHHGPEYMNFGKDRAQCEAVAHAVNQGTDRPIYIPAENNLVVVSRCVSLGAGH